MKTSVAWVPDCVGKRCSSVSCAFWDSMPGTVKSSLNEPPAKVAPAMRAISAATTESVTARGRRPASAAMRVRREVMNGKVHRLSLKIN